MKKLNRWIFIWVFILLTTSVMAEDIAVVARGEASGTGLTAKEKSLENALRNAVEKGFGVYIDSTTLTENAALISDEMVAETQGFIRSYDVLMEKDDGGLYITEVRAFVSMEKIWESDSLNLLLKRMGAPRFIIISNEIANEEISTGDPAREKMTEILVSKGFQLINSPITTSKQETGKNEITGDFENAINAAKNVNAEIIVFLKAKTSFEKQSNLYGKNITYFSGICEAKVIQVDSGAIIASAIGKAVRGAENPEEAIYDSLSFSAIYASEELIKGILSAWAKCLNMGRPIEVVIKKISISQLTQLFESLNQLEGVSQVSQRKYEARIAYLEIKSKHKTMYLAESIENIPGINLEVTDFSANKIQVTIR